MTKTKASAADLEKRCEQLGTVCGEKDKHIGKITEECKQEAKAQVEGGCTDKAIALYDCLEKELCGYEDKVWTLKDLRVLAERGNKCAAERDATRACGEKKPEGSAR